MHDATFSTAYRLEFDSSNLDTLFMTTVPIYQPAKRAIKTGTDGRPQSFSNALQSLHHGHSQTWRRMTMLRRDAGTLKPLGPGWIRKVVLCNWHRSGLLIGMLLDEEYATHGLQKLVGSHTHLWACPLQNTALPSPYVGRCGREVPDWSCLLGCLVWSGQAPLCTGRVVALGA